MFALDLIEKGPELWAKPDVCSFFAKGLKSSLESFRGLWFGVGTAISKSAISWI